MTIVVRDTAALSDDAWDAFALAQATGSVAHLSAFRHLETLWRGVEDVSLAVYADDSLIAILPLFVERSRELRFLEIRRLVGGTISGSGLLVSATLSASRLREVYRAVADAMQQLAERLRVDEAQLTYPLMWGERTALSHFRMHPLAEFGYPDTPVLAMVLDLRDSEAALLAQMNATTRNLIRRAAKQGVVVRPIDTEQAWMAVDAINRETLGSGALSVEALACVWRELLAKGHAFALGAYLDGQLISAVCITGRGAQAYYCLGFNAKAGLDANANRLVLWEAIRAAQTRGIRAFEVGGLFFGDSKEAAISRFKQAFGGRVYYLMSGRRTFRPVRAMSRGLIGAMYRRLRTSSRGRTPTDA